MNTKSEVNGLTLLGVMSGVIMAVWWVVVMGWITRFGNMPAYPLGTLMMTAWTWATVFAPPLLWMSAGHWYGKVIAAVSFVPLAGLWPVLWLFFAPKWTIVEAGVFTAGLVVSIAACAYAGSK